MIYLIKFDDSGRRGETYVKDEMTAEQVEELLQQGYIEVSQESYNLIIGNIDGKEYVRNEDGSYTAYVPPEIPPTFEEQQAYFTQAVETYMDKTAKTKGYDNIAKAITYYNSIDATFAAEARSLSKWRDKVWRKCYDILAEVKAGTRPIPANVEEVIAELPEIMWEEPKVDEVPNGQ